MKTVINHFALIDISYTCYGGFHFSILCISTSNPNIDSKCLFSIDVSNSFLYIGILFIDFEIYNNYEA